MAAVVNGVLYIGDKPASEDVFEHASTMDENMLIEGNAVLAGPVTFTATVTIAGTLVIV
jgi:hypothetical protein